MRAECWWFVAVWGLVACLPASADRPSDLTITSVQASPNPFGPNGYGPKQTTQFSVAYQLDTSGGLFAQDNGQGIDQRGTFILATTVQIGSVRTLVNQQQVVPLVGQGQQARPRFMNVSVQVTWDGRDSSGNVVPDGTYPYQVTARFYKQVTNPSGVHIIPRGSAGPVGGSVTTDTSPPSLAILSPADGLAARAQTIPVQILYSDENGVDPSTFSATLNGAPLSLTVGANQATGSLALAEGIYNLTATVWDLAGNRATTQSTFIVDRTPPRLSIASPSPGITNAVSLTFTANYADSLSGVDLSTFAATLNGSPVALAVGANSATATLPVTEAMNQVFAVTVSDRAGNQANAQVVFGVDRTPPVINVIEPPNGSTTDTSIPTLMVSYSDTGSGVDPGTFFASMDGVDISNRFALGDSQATTISQPLADGQHTLLARIADRAGNTSSASSTFTVNTNVPPPPPGTPGYIDGLVVDARSFQPLQGAQISVAGLQPVAQSGADGKFSYRVPGPGEWAVTITRDGYHYSQRRVVVEPNRDAGVGTVYLLAVDTVQVVSAANGGTVTDSTGNIVITFPAGEWDQDTPVRITLIQNPRELPNPQPDNVAFVTAFFGEPSGPLRIPVRVRFRNTLGLPAGTQLPIGYWNRQDLRWQGGAMATVSADGQWLEGMWTRFSSGGIWGAIINWLFSPGGSDNNRDEDPNDPCHESGHHGNSEVGYHFGDFQESLSIPTTRRLEQDWGMTLTYSSHTVDGWGHLVGLDMRNTRGAAPPPTARFAFTVEGTTAEAYFSVNNDVLMGTWLFDGRNGRGLPLPTGAYRAQVEYDAIRPVQLATTSYFGGPTIQPLGISSPFPGRVRARFQQTMTVHRRVDSSFGAGWGLRGVESLHPAPDGTVALVAGSGTSSFFQPGGIITTIAGTGTSGFSGDGGPATAAQFNLPVDVVTDDRNNVYIVDSGNARIRRIDAATGIVQTIAGGGTDATSEGIPATQASLGINLSRIAASSIMRLDSGTIYFADTNSNRIRKVDAQGLIWTVAGNGTPGFSGDGGPALQAEFFLPTGVAFDSFGNLYITDMGNNRLRMIDGTGTVTTIAGTGAAESTGDGLPAAGASLDQPMSVTVDTAGNIFIAENASDVRRIGTDGIITRFTGQNGAIGFTQDGQDASTSVFWGIYDVQAAPDGSILFTDRTNGRIRMIDQNGVLSTVAGSAIGVRQSYQGEGGPATQAQLVGPEGVAMDTAGNVYIADTLGSAIRKVSKTSNGRRVFEARPWDFSRLFQNPDGTYVREFKTGGRADYNAQGQIIDRVDRNGNTVTYQYSGNLLIGVQIPTGEVFSLAYGSDGRLVSITDPAGRRTLFNIDASGNLTSVTWPDGTSRSFTYDGYRMTSHTDEEGATTQILYDQFGKVTQEVTPHRDAQGNPETNQYTHASTTGVINLLPSGTGTEANPAPGVWPSALQNTFTDGRGNQNVIFTAPAGFVTGVRDAAGLPQEMLDLNRRALPNSVSLGSGLQLLITYDGEGNPTTVRKQAAGYGPFDTTATYDPVLNQITSITDALGRTTRLSYDSNGNPVSAQDATGSSTQIAYNSQGLPVQFTDALGNVSRIVYDGATGNALQFIDSLGRTTSLTRDAAGNIISVQDALSRVTQYTIDLMNETSVVMDALGERTVCSRNRRGQVTGVTNARGNATTYGYTPAGLLVSVTNSLGQTVSYTYDLARNITGVVNARGQQATLTYDVRNLLVQRQTPEDVTSYSYDPGQLLSAVGKSDSALSFMRDPDGRVTQETTGGFGLPQPQLSLASQYDAVGNRTSLQYSNLQGIDAGSLSYAWDAVKQLTSATGFAGEVFGFAHDSGHHMTGLTRPNGVTTTYAWDAANQLQSLTHTSPQGMLARFDYTYNVLGVRDSMTDVVVQPDNTSLGGPHVYGNNALNRLVSAQHPASEASFNPNETFSYDPVGNRLSDRLNPVCAYDNADRLVSDARFEYVFDADGNLAQRTERATGFLTRYTHDSENRLVRIDFSNGTYAAYSYDPMGRRFQKDVNGLVTRYAYDGLELIAEYDASGTPTLLARYTYGTSIDQPLCMERGGQTYMYHTDALGSVVQLTSSNGTVVQTYTYDAYGQLARASGTVQNPFTFTGRERDQESNLYYYRARYYDPSSGRFLEEDPVANNLVSSYEYCGGSPTNFIDPLGRNYVDRVSDCMAHHEFWNEFLGAPSAALARKIGEIESNGNALIEAGSRLKDPLTKPFGGRGFCAPKGPWQERLIRANSSRFTQLVGHSGTRAVQAAGRVLGKLLLVEFALEVGWDIGTFLRCLVVALPCDYVAAHEPTVGEIICH